MLLLKVIIEFLLSCALLTIGADRFIVASASIARHLNWSALIIGMLLVGFGTSSPEMVIAAVASYKGSSGIALGNAIGSSTTNIGLIVGLSALISPINIKSLLLKREFPILICISLLVGALMWNGELSRLDGVFLLAALVFYTLWMLRILTRGSVSVDALSDEYTAEMPVKMPLLKSWLWWCVGLILLLFSSEWLVNSATTIAQWLHVNDFIIGLTIVAVGTSLPELVITLISILRNEPDIAIGNVLGSNIFNLLAVMAMPAFISPGLLPPRLLSWDYPVMLGFTVIFWLFALIPYKKARINRVEGGILLFSFIVYLATLIMRA